MDNLWHLGDEFRGQSKVVEDRQWSLMTSKLAEITKSKADRMNDLDYVRMNTIPDVKQWDKLSYHQDENKIDHLNLSLMNLDLKMNDLKMNEAAMKNPFRNMAYMNPIYPKGSNGNVNAFKINVGVNKYSNSPNGKEVNGKNNGGNNSPASAMDDCIRRLEDERGKIEVFRRELPLCARLLADVIDVMKEEAEKKKGDREEEDGGAGDKSKWMSTAQLWTGNSGRDDADSEKQDKERSSSEVNSHGGGAFMPFKAVGSGAPAFAPPCFRKDDKAYDVGMPDLSLLSPAPTKSTPAAATGAADESRRQVVGFAQAAARAAAMAPSGPNLNLQTQSQQQQARKARRCWSPELHRQFVAALQQLGGPQVATPKQIRELMEVDGLTNDEVKSHLQKYRLHNRRAPSSAVVSQPILVVNPAGLWIPPEQSCSQSGSPQGPLHFSTSGIAVTSAATVSCEEEDGRSESYGWK